MSESRGGPVPPSGPPPSPFGKIDRIDIVLIVLFVILAVRPLVGPFGVIDPAVSDMFNNALNAAMLIYLARLDRRITPKVHHIDEAVTANLDTRVTGGRREHDPSDNSETSATSAT